MSYRLISYRDLYKDDLSKVIRPSVAKKILCEALSYPMTIVVGLSEVMSPLGNKSMQQKKLMRDIEEGRIMLVAMGDEFGTLGDCSSAGLTQMFAHHFEQVRLLGKERPALGGGGEEENELPDDVTPEVIPPTVAKKEEHPLVEFLYGWTEVKRNQTKKELFLELLPKESQAEKRALLERHNKHLGDSVRRGEMVVLLTRDPETEEEREELNKLKNEGAIGSRALHSLPEDLATTVVRQLPFLDFVVDPTFYQEIGTVAGALFSGMTKYFENMKSIIEKINKLYVDNVLGIGSKRHLPRAFYIKRASLFKQLDNVFYKMTFKWVEIPGDTKLKNGLGLSVKSTAYHGKEILTADGVLPNLYRSIGAVSKWIKNFKGLGRNLIILDIASSIPVVAEAFTSKEGEPVKTTLQEAARIAAGFKGGEFVAGAGCAAATFVVGLVGGDVAVAIAGVVGTVAGAYYGASKASEIASSKLIVFYEWAEDRLPSFLEETFGFFDWNVEQR